MRWCFSTSKTYLLNVTFWCQSLEIKRKSRDKSFVEQTVATASSSAAASVCMFAGLSLAQRQTYLQAFFLSWATGQGDLGLSRLSLSWLKHLTTLLLSLSLHPHTRTEARFSLSCQKSLSEKKTGKSQEKEDNVDWGHVSANYTALTRLNMGDFQPWLVINTAHPPSPSPSPFRLPPHSARLPPIRVEESSFSQDMQWLLERGVQFADVAFYAGDSGKELGWAHAAVLCAVSPYFRQLLLGPKTR